MHAVLNPAVVKIAPSSSSTSPSLRREASPPATSLRFASQGAALPLPKRQAIQRRRGAGKPAPSLSSLVSSRGRRAALPRPIEDTESSSSSSSPPPPPQSPSPPHTHARARGLRRTSHSVVVVQVGNMSGGGGGAPAALGAVPNVPAKLTTGIVTRQWSIVGSPHMVSLRHSTFTGFRYLLLNGAELHGTEGTSNIFNAKQRGDTVTLQVDQFFVEVTISPAGKVGFLYSCKVNGELVPDATVLPMDPHFQPEFQISIPGVIRSSEEEEEEGGVDKGVGIYYRVDTIRTRDGKGACNLRRFKHFAELNGNLKSSIYACHMVRSLPKFPAKGIKLLKRHDDPKFVEDRRKRLAEYLVFLSRVQLISQNAEFLRFLGITDAPKPKYKILGNGTYVVPPDYKQLAAAYDLRPGEYSVTFPLGSLGMVLKSDKNSDTTVPTVVSAFKSNPDGTPGPAQRSGKIGVGDALSRVNGANVYTDAQLVHRVRIGRIKAASRPLELHFIRADLAREERRKREAAEAEAAAAAAAAEAEDAGDEEGDKEEFEISDLFYRGEDLCLTIDGKPLVFTPLEVKHYTSLWEVCGAEDGALGGGEGVDFFTRSGLSEDDLAEVWRLSSGGRSLAELHKNNFFAALKFVALAQTGKDIAVESLFLPNPDGALALPLFSGEGGAVLDDGAVVAPEDYEGGEDELIF